MVQVWNQHRTGRSTPGYLRFSGHHRSNNFDQNTHLTHTNNILVPPQTLLTPTPPPLSASSNTPSSIDSYSVKDRTAEQLHNISNNSNHRNSSGLHSMNMSDNHEITGCPYGCCKNEGVADSVFRRGFLDGAYSDVTIKAFGTSYYLHRLILDQSSYFRSLFSWAERDNMTYEFKDTVSDIGDESDSSQNGEYDIVHEDDSYADYPKPPKKRVFDLEFDDDRITETSFELAISRLYGSVNVKEENKIPYSMIAVGQYLAINEAVCTATDYIVRKMDMSNISTNMQFATSNNYGSASERIIENGKGMLSSDGWEVGVEKWDEIPVSVIAQVVGEDYFFVPNEWDRCMFIIKLIERRLECNEEEEDIQLLKNVLNEKIHYCHMPPEQLQDLEGYYDMSGNPYIDPTILHRSLWQAVYLHKMVVTARDNSNLSNLLSSPNPPTPEPSWFRVPVKDETLSGLPTELDRFLSQSLSSSPSTQSTTPTPESDITSEESGKATQGILGQPEQYYTWTKIPPFRFSIAFANVSDLQSDKRVYSETFWYAGSYWNLYLQKNRIPIKNTYQVGVYLHRANSSTSNISVKNGLSNPDIFKFNVNYESSPKRYSQTSNFPSSDEFSSNKFGNHLETQEMKDNIQDDSVLTSINDLSLNDQRPTTTATTSTRRSSDERSFLTYEDHRSSIKVYFVIFTPSRRAKPTVTSFLSVPNDFSRSQSWGWKSNSMCVFNEDGSFPEGHDPHLKFMIVLGNV